MVSVEGPDWRASPMMRMFAISGGLNAPYLCAFLKHHKMQLKSTSTQPRRTERCWAQSWTTFAGSVSQGHTWDNWLREEFHSQRTPLNLGNDAESENTLVFVEKQLPGQNAPTPFTNFAGYRLLTKLCLHKSKIAKEMYDKALLLLGHVSVGDQRLHAVLDDNAAASSQPARAFVMGVQEERTQEAEVRRMQKSTKPVPMDLEAFERQCLEDDDMDPEVAARRLAKVALARQYRDSGNQHMSLVKRQKLAELDKYEAEVKASKEKFEAEGCAPRFLKQHPVESMTSLRVVIYEKDRLPDHDYDAMEHDMSKSGWTCEGGFHRVCVRQ